VQEGLGFDRVGIFEVDAEQDCVRGRMGVDQLGKQENIEKEKYSLKEEDNNFAKIALGKLKFFFTENADLSLPPSQKKYMIAGVGQNAVVPMEARGSVIGMIAVDNFITKKPIMKEDIHLLMTFADQAAIALQNARMFGKEREASVRFKKLEDTKNNIISKLSHELRTPLVSIKESISLVLQRIAGEITPNEEKFLNIAKSNTERLTLLIDELLESAKMETLEIKLEFSGINLAKLVNEVLSEIKLQADVKDVLIKTEINASIPVIHGDKNKLFRVLSNLIGNSIKYSNKKGRLFISADQNDKDVLVFVKDDGIGIEEANLKSVFEKFYRVEDPSVEESGGIGLGLTISKEIVEAHGGHIWVESEGLGKGSTFTFSLPKG
jgi:signal transduction histidine kinase